MNEIPEVPERLPVSATAVREVYGGKSSGMLSERGLELAIERGDIPAPMMFGRYRRWALERDRTRD